LGGRGAGYRFGELAPAKPPTGVVYFSVIGLVYFSLIVHTSRREFLNSVIALIADVDKTELIDSDS
ncbi:MAG: hypothetical protein ACREOU_10710, partial [Candidatus Eiseniibacteriota bacterium]